MKKMASPTANPAARYGCTSPRICLVRLVGISRLEERTSTQSNTCNRRMTSIQQSNACMHVLRIQQQKRTLYTVTPATEETKWPTSTLRGCAKGEVWDE